MSKFITTTIQGITMKIKSVSFYCLFAYQLLFYNPLAIADCDAVLRFAGKEQIDTFINVLNRYSYHDQYCDEYQKRKAEGGSMLIPIPDGANGFFTFGMNVNAIDEMSSKACAKTDISTLDNTTFRQFISRVNNKAMDAWEKCIQATQNGLVTSADKLGTKINVKVGFAGRLGVQSIDISNGDIYGGTCKGELNELIKQAASGNPHSLQAGGNSVSAICEREYNDVKKVFPKDFGVIVNFSDSSTLSFHLPNETPVITQPTCDQKDESDTEVFYIQTQPNCYGRAPSGEPAMCNSPCNKCRNGNAYCWQKFDTPFNIDKACIMDLRGDANYLNGGADCAWNMSSSPTTKITYKDKLNQLQSIRVDGDCNSLKSRLNFPTGCQ